MGIAAAVGAAGAVAGAGAQAGVGAAAAGKAAKGARRIYEAGAAEREAMSQQVAAEADIARENLRAAEEARLRVGLQLGAPGTYGPEAVPTEGMFGITPTGLGGLAQPGAPVIPGGLWGEEVTRGGRVTGEDVKLKKKKAFKGAREWEVTGRLLDPEQMAAAVTAQPGFRAVSGMVAEANQLMARQGPLWNELNNSVTGGVYESAAAMQRQQMEEISRMQARGGTARRVGLAMAQRFRAQEQVNRQRTSQLWQSRMALEQYRTTAAQQNLSYAQSWVNNQAGIRDAFTSALSNLRTFWSQTIPPVAIPAAAGSEAAMQRAQAPANQARMDIANSMGQAIGGAVESITGAVTERMAGGGTEWGFAPGATEEALANAPWTG